MHISFPLKTCAAFTKAFAKKKKINLGRGNLLKLTLEKVWPTPLTLFSCYIFLCDSFSPLHDKAEASKGNRYVFSNYT